MADDNRSIRIGITTGKEPDIPPVISQDIQAAGGLVNNVGEALFGGFVPTESVPLPEGDLYADPSLGEKVSEAGLGAVEGALTGSTTLGSGLAGARTLATLGTMYPVLGPYTPVVAGTVGFLGGVTAGFLASQPISEWFPIPAREDLISWREGGKTAGSGIGAAPVAYGIPVMSANKVSRFLSGIGEAARARPKRFLLGESTAATSAGVAGGMAVEYMPDSPGARFTAELAGGVFNPTRLFINGSSMAADKIKGMISAFSPGSREAKAAQALQNILEMAGEDPNQVIKMLSRPDLVDPRTGEIIPLTAGQKTGIPVLNELERALANKHSRYSQEVTKQGENALLAYSMLIDRLENIGTQQALEAAAELRNVKLNSVLEARLNAAHADAAAKIAKINRGETPAIRREIGEIVKTEVEGALKEARAFEKQLWDNAYKASFNKQDGLFVPGTNVPLKTKEAGPFKGEVALSEEIAPDSLDFRLFTVDKKGNPVVSSYDRNSPEYKQWVKNSDALSQVLGKTVNQASFVEDIQRAVASIPEEMLDMTGQYVTLSKQFLQKIPRKTTKLEVRPVYSPKTIDTPNTFEAYLDFVSDKPAEWLKYRISPEVRAMMDRLGIDATDMARYERGKLTDQYFATGKVPSEFLPRTSDFNPLPVNELVKIRSALLDSARDAAAKGEASDAAFYGKLAQAALEDLSKLGGKEYDQARNFSKALNDTYTRTFAGETQAVKATGAEKIPAEVLVSRSFGRNADVTSLRMEQMEDAAGFLRSEYEKALQAYGPRNVLTRALKDMVPSANNRIASVRDAHARVMRVMAANAIDLQTGRLDVNKLVAFAKENKPTLDRLGITPDLEDAAVAENYAKQVLNVNSKINQTVREQTAFAQLLAFENPTEAIGSALNSKFPVKNFYRMAKLAKAGGPKAVAGMRATVYDYIFSRAAKGKNYIDPQAVEDALFNPIAPNQPSIYNIMRTQGLMTMQDAKNMKRLLEPMKRIQKALDNKEPLDDVVAGADLLTDLALRVIGSKIGTTASGSGSSIVAAGAGSRFARMLFDKMPVRTTTKILEDATRDPKLMELLLKKARTPTQRVQLARSLHSYLTAAGYNYADYEGPTEEDLVSPVTGPTAAQMLRQVAPRQLPPAPPTRGVPGLTGQKPAGGPTPPAAGGPTPPNQSRAMLQSLFPFDTTLSVGLPRQ